MAEDKNGKTITAVEAAALVADATVRVPKTDKKGVPVVIAEGEDKGRFDVVERPVGPRDVLAFAERGDQVTVVTVDGQRLTATKKR